MEKLNPREQAKHYLATNKIPQMFESLIAALMVVMPEDPVAYIEERMEEIRQVGLDRVNWESFVYHLHPYRHPVRLQLIRDGSKYDKEYTTNLLKAQQQLAEEERAARQRAKEEEEAQRKEMEASLLSGDTLADLRDSTTDAEYDPDVFQLTETKD